MTKKEINKLKSIRELAVKLTCLIAEQEIDTCSGRWSEMDDVLSEILWLSDTDTES
jgi:hypothetical protein